MQPVALTQREIHFKGGSQPAPITESLGRGRGGLLQEHGVLQVAGHLHLQEHANGQMT